MDWTSIHPLEKIYGWFDYLEATYDFCESEIIGQTFEGRIMKVMKVYMIHDTHDTHTFYTLLRI